ncbi:hypothetical protein [Cupriavidus taiwanensis]|uniref:hypothetical protein n=1 Tax=Cupriavidus taiwanensis TaxID=164546 RepID=UPI000E1050C5|nr:hypothetical protein [Cupriavidus taiwanensis]SPA56703.1 conserved protein of unknown function [Cupriavidus taiwanensis]
MKLTDLSPQAAFKSQGLEPLFRRLKRLGDKGASEEAMRKVLEELLPHLDDNPVALEMKSPLNGDKEALRRVEDTTRFEFMFAGLGVERQDYNLHRWFMLLSERVGFAAALDLKKGDGVSAGRRIAEHPILVNLLWPEARERFERGTSEQQLAPLLVSLAMQCTLAAIAAWDRHLGRREGTDRSFFQPIIPSIKQPGRNPSSLFFDELQRRLGAKSIGALLASREGSQSKVQQWTLDRWSAGISKPDFESVQDLLQAYGKNHPKEVLFSQFWCTRYLHLLGHIGQYVSKMARRLPASASEVVWPWPKYPFGYPSFEAWTAERYPK